jgi:hypothetical protein
LVGFTIVGLEPATAGSRDSNEGWLLRLRRSRANRNHLSYNRHMNVEIGLQKPLLACAPPCPRHCNCY